MSYGNTSAVMAQLNSDPNFAVDFIIDNNPEEVQAQLSGLNLLSVAPQNATVPSIKSDVRRISDGDTLQEVLTVPYINDNSNYTGGLESELTIQPFSKSGTANSPGYGIAVINGITSFGTALANVFVSQNQQEMVEVQAGAAYDQALIGQEINQANIEAGKTFGIPTSAFIAIIGAIVVLFSIVLISTKD